MHIILIKGKSGQQIWVYTFDVPKFTYIIQAKINYKREKYCIYKCIYVSCKDKYANILFKCR
jgi:hypothetical protein